MNYINTEEFLKRPKETQNIILDWWKPEIGDLIYNKKYNTINVLEENYEDKTSKNLLLYFSIPLLTEGQLRKFIEEESKCGLLIYTPDKNMEACIQLFNNDGCIYIEIMKI